MASLNAFRWLQRSAMACKRFYYRHAWGMDLHPTCRFSLSARFDTTYPRGLHVGAFTYIAFDAAILTHDMTRALYTHTRIGDCCFIGARSVVLPGVAVGNQCIVAAGAVVTKDVPPNSLVAGNPARIVRENLDLLAYGRFRTRAASEAAKEPAGERT